MCLAFLACMQGPAIGADGRRARSVHAPGVQGAVAQVDLHGPPIIATDAKEAVGASTAHAQAVGAAREADAAFK